MKVAVTTGRGDISFVDIPVPSIGPYRCLCKTLACATCTGTDVKIIHNQLPWEKSYPGILGHESIGQVVEIGKKVRYIKEGDIFLRPTAVYKGEKTGPYYSLWGGFAEYGLITDIKALQEDMPDEKPGYAKFQMRLPPDVNIHPAEAIMLITLKETSGYVKGLKIRLNDSVVILGAGAVGMAMCFFAKISGAFPLIAIARRDEPLEYIRRFGANFTVNNKKEDMAEKIREITKGAGVRCIIDTAGDEWLIAEALDMLSEDGKISPYATFKSADALNHIDKTKILKAKTGEIAAHEYLLDLVRMKAINLKDFYSHVMPFSDIQHGFEMIKSKKAFKVVFEM